MIHKPNLHDTKTGYRVATLATFTYPTLEKICAAVIAAPLSTRLTNISLERTFAWLNPSRRLSKDYELTATSAETMIKISHIHTLLKRL